MPIASTGDRDRVTDLRRSPPDFFTRELDDALLEGDIDLAVHSAKDLPDELREGLFAAWLPDREDPRDALVLRPGERIEELPSAPVIGVSSDRRAAWCARRFPRARLRSIRGNIEERLEQLDSGKYDAVVMAVAVLRRLGLADRITLPIPLEELPVPEMQGVLAVTFRADDPATAFLRDRFPLTGCRVLLTGSPALREKGIDAVLRYGGRPVVFPLIEPVRRPTPLPEGPFDRVLVTSPSAARLLAACAPGEIPPAPIVACGPGTAEALAAAGLDPLFVPEKAFGGAGLLESIAEWSRPGMRILRLRSDRAGPDLAEALRARGLEVTDFVFYETRPRDPGPLPLFDAAVFCSASAAEVFLERWGVKALAGKTVVAIGNPTARRLIETGAEPLTAEEPILASAVARLATCRPGSA